MTAHIQIARGERAIDGRTGPKAAFDFYLSQNTPTAQAQRDEIRSAGNAKKQFTAYCAKFGDQFGIVNGNGAVRSEGQKDTVRETVARLLGRTGNGVVAFEDNEVEDEVDPLVKLLAERLNVSVETLADIAHGTNVAAPVVETPAPVKKQRVAPTATRVSYRMAMAILRICNKHNVPFEITGKTGGEGTGQLADYAIKVNGQRVNPAEASALIDANKKA